MNASDEARIILDTLSFLWTSKEDIVAWANRRISESINPSTWLIDLSTMDSPRLADYISVLAANASERQLTTEEKVLMSLDCYECGAMDLSNTLGALSSIWLGEDSRAKTIRLDTILEEVLNWWEQVDGHGDRINEDLQTSAHNAFYQFRQAHADLRNPLPGLNTDDGQQGKEAKFEYAPQ